MHDPWHWSSWGQTRPVTSGSVTTLNQFERPTEVAVADAFEHLGDVDADGAAPDAVIRGLRELSNFTRAFLALLVAQHLEPHEHVDLASRQAEIHVAQVALVHQVEVFGPHVGFPDVRSNGDVGWPRGGEPLEHGVAVGHDAVDAADERALLAHGEAPNEPHEHRACIAIARENAPERFDEFVAQLGLLELPSGRGDPILDEHVPEGRGVFHEPTLEKVELLLEGLHTDGSFEAFDLVRRGF